MLDINRYIQSLDAILAMEGLTPTQPTGFTLPTVRLYHKKKFSLLAFGPMDTFVPVVILDHPVSIQEYVTLSSQLFNMSNQLGSSLPNGLFSATKVFPLIICPGVALQVTSHISQFNNARFSAFEFPVLLDSNSGLLHYMTKTPFWGMAVWNRVRNDAVRYFTPH